jgi:hypothetical protein
VLQHGCCSMAAAAWLLQHGHTALRPRDKA